MHLESARILVVEDEYLLAIFIQDELERAGAKVIGPVASVADAFELMANADFDAAVLNVNVEDGSIFPVAEALRERGKPFVFVTAYERFLLPETFVSIPHLVKPVKPAALIEVLLTFLQERAKGAVEG